MKVGGNRLDLRLVPAALTSWAVTAAGILWHIGGSVAALVVAIVATAALGRWGSGRQDSATGLRAVAAGVIAETPEEVRTDRPAYSAARVLRHHQTLQRRV